MKVEISKKMDDEIESDEQITDLDLEVKTEKLDETKHIKIEVFEEKKDYEITDLDFKIEKPEEGYIKTEVFDVKFNSEPVKIIRQKTKNQEAPNFEYEIKEEFAVFEKLQYKQEPQDIDEIHFDDLNNQKNPPIETTLNKVENENRVQIVIKVDGTVGDNYRKKPLERNSFKKLKPSTSEVIKKKRERFQITEDQKNELVEHYLGLTENFTENLARNMAIKNFYQKFMPVEFEAHEKLDDWATAKVSEIYLRKWTRKYFQEIEISEKLAFEKLEREKLKTVDEIQQEKKLEELKEIELQEKKLREKELIKKQMQEKELQEKQLKEFLDKPRIIIEITPHEKKQIIFRLRWKIKI